MLRFLQQLKSWAFLIGIALFIFIVSHVDIQKSWLLIQNSKIKWLLLALLFLLPEIFSKALRLKLLVNKQKAHITLWHSLQVYLSGQPLGILTPAKLGDVSRVLVLQKTSNLRTLPALATHIADKSYDLISLSFLALLGILSLVVQSENYNYELAILSGILIGMLLMYACLNPKWMKSIFRPIIATLTPSTLSSELQKHGTEFYSKLQVFFSDPVQEIIPFALSIFAWESAIFRGYLCALALQIPISLLSLVRLLPSVIVAEFIPVSILGFGTREFALFLFFLSPEISKSALLSFSLITVLVGPIFSAMLGSLVLTKFMRREKRHG